MRALEADASRELVLDHIMICEQQLVNKLEEGARYIKSARTCITSLITTLCVDDEAFDAVGKVQWPFPMGTEVWHSACRNDRYNSAPGCLRCVVCVNESEEHSSLMDEAGWTRSWTEQLANLKCKL